ncbi:hypothetical protein F5I97DRAFT_1923159 [Phlebopus sp. FC_14]|nr:hypothetical protein F5I97DRAFT_1923159 [Phlebopus sp. FC_14]
MATTVQRQSDFPQSTVLLGDVPLKTVPVLQEQYYRITPEQAAFFKERTGITDDEELKRHILAVQAEAYKVAPYPCIMGFVFLSLLLSRFSVYKDVLSIGRSRPGAILLDVGCCVGTDLRKAAADGFSAERTIGSDLHPEFGDLGHKLFKTTPETYPGHFVPGDIFDPAMLSVVPPFESAPMSQEPDLRSLTSLNPLQGRVSAIHAANFFHLFDEDKQLHLARGLAGLLASEPGSVICGSHWGLHEKGRLLEKLFGSNLDLFCHSPESWREMWEEKVFAKGQVKVEARLLENNMEGYRFWYMGWSVKRL